MSFDHSRLPAPAEFFAALDLPRWKVQGRQGRACCPFHKGANSTSFSVNLDSGVFRCFACDAKGGGLIDFLMLRDGIDFKTAAASLGAWRGAAPARAASNPSLEPAHPPKAEQARAGDQVKDERTKRQIMQIRGAARPLQAGDAVSQYLNRRGISAPFPAALRTVELAYWSGDQQIGTFPAMVAEIEAAGEVVGIHRTWIGLPEGLPRKKILGKGAGVIWLDRIGSDGLLAVAEGIETALSVRQLYGLPVAASISAGGLANFPIDGIRDLRIYADRDEPFPEGHPRAGERPGAAAALALATRAVEAGIAVSIIQPVAGCGDFNDMLVKAN